MGRGLDGFLMLVRAQQWAVWRCAVLKDRGGGLSPVSGGYGEGETPLPIPNRAVKPPSADGTWPARAWESRSPPVFQPVLDPAAPLIREWRGRVHLCARRGVVTTPVFPDLVCSAAIR